MNERRLTTLSARFLNDLAEEMQRARVKFPGNEHMHAAMAEEVGEVANALIENDIGHATNDHVWKECVQAAAMALRVATEGDPSFSYQAPYFLDMED